MNADLIEMSADLFDMGCSRTVINYDLERCTPMAVELTPTYIATVRPDHIIVLPEEMPVGAQVMVILVPPKAVSVENDPARAARFAATLAAIKAAMENPIPNPPTDEELKALVEKARKTPPG
jgi:hypothetical protein